MCAHSRWEEMICCWLILYSEPLEKPQICCVWVGMGGMAQWLVFPREMRELRVALSNKKGKMHRQKSELTSPNKDKTNPTVL